MRILIALYFISISTFFYSQLDWVHFYSKGVKDVETDSLGNIYLLGIHDSDDDFDLGPNVYTLPTGNNNSTTNCYIAKLNPSGGLVWAQTFGEGSNYFALGDLHLDHLGNIYIGGAFNGAFDFVPGNGQYSVVSQSTNDGFYMKLNSQGEFQWVNILRGFDLQEVTTITTDYFGNVFVGGTFRGDIDLNSGLDDDIYNCVASFQNSNGFIVKVDSNGA